MTFCVSQIIVVATVFIANNWLLVPSTSLVVKVIGNLLSNCPFDECKISTTVRSGFLRHLFCSTFFQEILQIVYHARIAQQNKEQIDFRKLEGRDRFALDLDKSNVWICSVDSKTCARQKLHPPLFTRSGGML